MSCSHRRQVGYAFCGECGVPTDAPVCRCGFVGVHDDHFCGQCGRSRTSAAGESTDDGAIAGPRPSHRLDLARLIREAAADEALAPREAKGHVNQDDIKALIKARRGRSG